MIDTKFISRNGYSSRREFKCKQGPDCVQKDNVCDGTNDCSDGSDEGSCMSQGWVEWGIVCINAHFIFLKIHITSTT